ncbi:cobalamin biosynthesis protein CobD/CbiB [Paraglaciecola sp.]|uniref:cobalamin biosynthesis protein CobD/CbiB n=1 Tax=Paraglaciecola sp. TaxID=1920173 RepID=UPI003EF82D3B
MLKIVETLFSQELLTFWVILIAVLIEKYMPWPDKYHPLSLWKICTIRIANKVLPSKESDIQQQKLSGSLAYLVLLTPVCLSIWILLSLSVYPAFFEALLLLIALRYRNIQLTCHKLSQQITLEKKILARQNLQQHVLRETEKMSVLGLAKAASETLILRFSYQYCAVIFWFALTGGIGAIVYRLLYECSHSWNIKQSRFSYFGLSVKYVTNALQWFPSILCGFSLAFVSLTIAGFKALSELKNLKNTRTFLLNIAGASLNIEMAGPAIYQQKKIRTTKCGGHKPIILADIKRTQNLISLTTLFWLTMSFLIYASVYALTK